MNLLSLPSLSRRFIVLWLGQSLSLAGSRTSAFALGIWTLRETSSVSQFALALFAGALPAALLAPIAGAVVDRYSRRSILIACEATAALCAILFLATTAIGTATVPQVLAFLVVTSAISALHWPAYSATVPRLVDASKLGQANGVVQVGSAVAHLTAPLLGTWLGTVGLPVVIAFDLFSFVIGAVTALLLTADMAPSVEPVASWQTVVNEAFDGARYLVRHRALGWVVMLMASSNLLLGAAEVLALPVALTMMSETYLGVLLTGGGVGMVAGGLALSVWDGRRCQVRALLLFDTIISLSLIALSLSFGVIPIFVAVVAFFFSMPIIGGITHALLQTHVEPRLLGRVFVLLSALVVGALPVAYVTCAALVDHVVPLAAC